MTSPFNLAWQVLKQAGTIDHMENMMADDVLDPISEDDRRPKQKEFNPFKPQPRIPPMREERGPLMGGNEAMSRGPLRSRKRGQPDSGASFSRPGFRSNENMPLTDRSMQMREAFE